jgi:hypothetical protein
VGGSAVETSTLNIIWIVCIVVGALSLLTLLIYVPIATWRVRRASTSPLGLFDPEEMNEIRTSAANSGMASLKRKASTQQLLAPADKTGSLVRRSSMSKGKAGAAGETPRKGERPANADRKHSEMADRVLRAREGASASTDAVAEEGSTQGDTGGGVEATPTPVPAPAPAAAPAAAAAAAAAETASDTEVETISQLSDVMND